MSTSPWLWVPISLDVDHTTQVIPMVDYAQEGEFVAFPSAPAAKSITSFSNETSFSHVDAAFSIGLFGMLNASTEGQWERLAHDYTASRAVTASAGGKVGYEILWGYGFRLHLLYEKLEASLGVSSPQQISFASQLGLSRTSYGAEMFGVTDPAAFRWMPPPGPFDVQTYSVVDASMKGRLSELMVAAEKGEPEGERIAPVPMALKFDGSYAGRAKSKALSVAFAAHAIQREMSLGDALKKANGRSWIIQDEVKRVYDLWRAAAQPAFAKRVAESWLSDGVSQKELDQLLAALGAPAVQSSPDGAGTLSKEKAWSRVVMRSQLFEASTANNLGYAPVGAFNETSSSMRLVYELWSRDVMQNVELKGGISVGRGLYAGLRLQAAMDKVDGKLQASFPGAAASAALQVHASRMALARQSFGLSALAEAQILNDSSPNPQEFGKTYAAVESAKAKIAADPTLLRPEEASFLVGCDYEERGFPGARAIYFASVAFEGNKYANTARSKLRRMGLDTSHANAVYASYWAQASDLHDPPSVLREQVRALLAQADV